MTEYTSSSEAIREYASAKQRTMAWVHNHSPYPEAHFYSPSDPPSPRRDLDYEPYVTSESDMESSHSLPPRMVLRYPDGRDVRVSHDYYKPKPPPSHTPAPTHRTHSRYSSTQVHPSLERGSSHSRSRSGSSVPQRTASHSSSYHAGPGDYTLRPGTSAGPYFPAAPVLVAPQPSRISSVVPPHHTLLSSSSSSRPRTAHSTSIRPQEDIRVLPSRGTRTPQPVIPPPIYNSRNPTGQSHQSQVPQRTSSSRYSGQPPVVSPTPHRAYTPSHHTLLRAPPVAVSQSQPSVHLRDSPTPAPIEYSQSHPPPKYGNGSRTSAAQSTYPYQPPPIVYAPSKHSNNAYTPPAVIYSPSSRQHSTRNGQTDTRARSTSGIRSRTPIMSSSESWSIIEESRSNRDPRNRRPFHADHSPPSPSFESPTLDDSSSESSSSLSSGASKSTYYVIATPGQKVQLIIPDKTSYATASQKKSPMSPPSPPSRWSSAGRNGPSIKPFFSRLFRRDSDKRSPRNSGNKASRSHSMGRSSQRR